MVLIRTDYPNFEAYLAAISRKARKNFAWIAKHYPGIKYQQLLGAFPEESLQRFMTLWEQQLVRGKTPEWAFPIGHVRDLWDKGELKIFYAKVGTEDVAMHFIQKRDGYWECHPPMYDKTKHPSIAKVMWFNLIRWAISTKMDPLDFGGGPSDWREHLMHRDEYPNPHYKWIYVPERAKRHPETEPAYYIESCQLLLRD